MKKSVALLIFLCPFLLSAQIITNFAGNGISSGISSDGVPATTTNFGYPQGVACDRYGNYYYSDFGNKIRKVTTTDTITSIAGTGALGFSGDSGQATAAAFKYPEGVAFDSAGNLYISDHQNFRIRKIDMTTGIITTVYGTGSGTDGGDGGPASVASFFPNDIHFDERGNLYIAEPSYSKIRKINTRGIISTYAGTGVAGFSGDSGPATAAKLWQIGQLAVDNKDNLYFVDHGNNRVRKIDTFGIITTVAGTGIAIYDGDGIPATAAQIGPYGIGIDKYNNIYISDTNERIRMVDTFGIIHTIVGTGVAGYNGNGIPATSAQINAPSDIIFDACDNMYFIDGQNYRIRKVTFNPSCNIDSLLSLNVSSLTTNLEISIYPNPATDELTITSSNKIAQVSITNVIGSPTPALSKGEGAVRVNISGWPPGVYVVAIIDEDGNKIIKKVVKE